MNQPSKYKALVACVFSIGLVACGDETTVNVTTDSDVNIPKATVSMSGITEYTDNRGQATIIRKDAKYDAVLSIEAPGYISQSITVDGVQSDDVVKRSVSAKLKAKNPVQVVEDISLANKVTLKDGSVFVDFTPNSFVTTDGSPATGKAEVTITTWDPTNPQDMSAFLGDGVAQTLQGDIVQLVSYGAMTVEFSQNGQKLQLANGKKATISMPLTFDKHYDGKAVKAGDTIPMWYFSEEKGLWVEEGQGQVITNPQGDLLLTADVAHFTTWNWDMKMDNPASMFVKCQLADGTATMCDVSASITYNNGASTKLKSTTVPETGVDVINIDPNLDSLALEASYYDHVTDTTFVGAFMSNGLPNTDAVIKLETLEKLSIKCQLPSGATTDCIVSGSVSYDDRKSTQLVRQSATQAGITVNKYPNLTDVNLSAEYFDESRNKVLSGTFTATNLTNNEAIIILDKESDVDDGPLDETFLTNIPQYIDEVELVKGATNRGSIGYFNNDVLSFEYINSVSYHNPGQEVVRLGSSQYSLNDLSEVRLVPEKVDMTKINKEAIFVIKYSYYNYSGCGWECGSFKYNVTKTVQLYPVKTESYTLYQITEQYEPPT
ncbi:MAG: hypothetical protein CR966_00405 [Pseudomonadales bacterium]|nr:MAG: hypothetical protein CR966_00405 [Pseudomonadales bacterium]